MANTFYDILEVIPTASQETIHAAYRSLISRNHPDKAAALGPELQAAASARTKEINHAYDILRDTVRRASYDKELLDRQAPPLHWQDFAPEPPDPPAQPVVYGAWKRGPRAILFSIAAGTAVLLALPQAANVAYGVADFLVTGQAQSFQDVVNSTGGNLGNSGLPYLLVWWGWLFINYLFGMISYRFGVAVGDKSGAGFGEPFTGTNGRLFLLLAFVGIITGREMLFSAHTMTDILADMFVIAGAYQAERGFT